MTPPFNSRRKQNYLLSPSPQTKNAHAVRGLIFVIVDIASDLLNSVKSFMFEWSGYFTLPENRNLAWQ